jgi:hypothetical protein
MTSDRVIVSHLEPFDFEPLLPAPGVNDDCGFPKILTPKTFDEGIIKIYSDYRGNLLFLENGYYVYRLSPLTAQGNGYTAIPENIEGITEECIVGRFGKWFKARVKFV